MAQWYVPPEQVKQIRDGVYISDLTGFEGVSGQPVEAGLVVTEQNPNYHPIEARGYHGIPGRYQSYAKHSAVQTAFQRRKKALAAAPWRLERPKFPDHLRKDKAALEAMFRQWELVRYLWWRWTRPGDGWLAHFIRENALQVPECGFALYELAADYRPFTFSDWQVRFIYDLKQPAYRAQASVSSWLFQGDSWIGAVLESAGRTQYDLHYEPASTALPANKLLLCTRDRIGSQVEGISEIRSVATHVELHWGLAEQEALSIERHGSGEMMFEAPPGSTYMAPEDEVRLDEYLQLRQAGQKVAGLRLPPGIVAKIINASATLPEVKDALDRHYRAIFIGTGSEDRAMAVDGGGSYAARSVASADALTEYDDDARQFVIEPLHDLMTRAIRWSGLDEGRDEWLFLPEITSAPLKDTSGVQELLQGLSMAVGQGLLKWSEDDEARLRDWLPI